VEVITSKLYSIDYYRLNSNRGSLELYWFSKDYKQKIRFKIELIRREIILVSFLFFEKIIDFFKNSVIFSFDFEYEVYRIILVLVTGFNRQS